MRPHGHVFYVFSDVGQRPLWSPLDLAERHRNQANARTRFPRDQASSGPYNRPGIIKSVNDGFVYYTVAEKIQDAFNRAALASHTMIFPLEELMEDGGALLPPATREEYQALGLPSEVHSQGRRLEEIQHAIDQCVAMSEVRTMQVSPGWNTREINWLLGNPRSIISGPADGFSAEAAISGLLAGLPPLVSAGLSFATGYVPNGGSFHITAYSGSANQTSSRGVSAFRSGASFKAAIESAPDEKVMETDREWGFHLALAVTSKDPLDVLDAFRNGFHQEGNTQETITANLIAQALSEDDRRQRTLEALERSIGGIEEFPQGAKEIIRNALAPLTHRSNSAREQSQRLIGALSPSASVLPRPASRNDEANADRDPGSQNIPAESSYQEFTQGDIDDVWVALDELKRIIQDDFRSGQGPEAGVEAVSSGVRKFTGLVIAGGPGLLQSEELPGLVQSLWREINGWVTSAGNGGERPRLIREAIGYRKDPGAPSLFDDLMYITWQTRHLEEHADIADIMESYRKLMNKVLGLDRPFWRWGSRRR